MRLKRLQEFHSIIKSLVGYFFKQSFKRGRYSSTSICEVLTFERVPEFRSNGVRGYLYSTRTYSLKMCNYCMCSSKGTSIRGVLYHETEKITRVSFNHYMIQFS